jgi:carboxymethylenebutenolidase
MGKMIDFQSNSHTTPGYLALPDGPGPFPGVVVIQEWWGLVPHIKDVADRFAAAGFVALAPDLYHGQEASEPDEARKLVMELDRERAQAEIGAAMRYLQSLAAVAPKKIGVVGFCMGGALSIATAAVIPQTGAAVAFYGGVGEPKTRAAIHAPLLGLYAEHDSTTAEMVHDFDAALQQAGLTHEMHIYPGTQHAFFNDARPHIYNPQAAADAWQRTLAWFRKHLTTN